MLHRAGAPQDDKLAGRGVRVNPLDLSIGIFLLLAGLAGMAKGLFRLLLAGGSLLAAWWAAISCYRPLADGLFPGPGASPATRLATFAVLFLGVVLVLSLAGRLVIRFLRLARLRWMDRLAGGLAGVALAGVLTAALLLPLTAVLPPGSPLLARSRTAPYFLALTGVLVRLVPRTVRHDFLQRRQETGEGSGSRHGG
ncbi:MAG: CvpA family protein [Acidobacteriota bacterium]